MCLCVFVHAICIFDYRCGHMHVTFVEYIHVRAHVKSRYSFETALIERKSTFCQELIVLQPQNVESISSFFFKLRGVE